jgi:hypothetical protein
MNIVVETYKTWVGDHRITLDSGARQFVLTRDEARMLRDDLKRILEEITQDEEREREP